MIDSNWGLERLRAGQPLRIAAGGLTRSGSTWQFMALVLLLEAVVERYSSFEDEGARTVHAAYGHQQELLDICLGERYCVVKTHEMMPDVVPRVDAIFVSHRNVRDVLASSARIFSSCLLYGNQPLAAYFEMYASWLPYACHDMQYETKVAEGDAMTVRRHAASLGVPCSEALAAEIAARLEWLTHGGAHGDLTPQQRRDLARDFPVGRSLDGTPTHITSTSHDAEHAGQVRLKEASTLRHCNRTAELALVEDGFGRWMVEHGYYVDEADAARLNRSSNAFVAGLPQAAELMGMRPLGWASGGLCPRRTRWTEDLRRAGVMSYSQTRINFTGGPHSLKNGYDAVSPAEAVQALHVLALYLVQEAIRTIPRLLRYAVLGCFLLAAGYAFRELQRSDQRSLQQKRLADARKCAV